MKKLLSLAQSLLLVAVITCPMNALFADEIADAAAKGKAKYVLCAACHGFDGKGMEPIPGTKMAPSFQESKLVKMNPEVSALILFKGIKKDDPTAYMGQVMMPLATINNLSDDDVANLITYIRSEFGGVKELIKADQVAEWKAKHAATAQPSRADLEKMGKEDAKAE